MLVASGGYLPSREIHGKVFYKYFRVQNEQQLKVT